MSTGAAARPEPEGDEPLSAGAGAAPPSALPAALAAAFDAAPVGTAVVTGAGVLVRANPALAALVGRAEAALVGARLPEVADPRDAEAVDTLLRRAAHLNDAGGSPSRVVHAVDVRLRHDDGSSVAVTLTCVPVPQQAAAPGLLVLHAQDRTGRLADAELAHRALHDPLTGLPNRVLLQDRLTRALDRLHRGRSAVAVLFADLDGFKIVNDTYGHAAGDQVLAVVAHRLVSVQRAGDTACRYGGDEFVVLCEDSATAEADSVAARIRRALSTPVRVVTSPPDDPGLQVGVDVQVSVSIGIAATSDPATPAQHLLHQADLAMYQARQLR